MAKKGDAEVDLGPQILVLLKKAGKLTYEEIDNLLGADGVAPYSEELWSTLRQLMKDGEVVDVGGGKRSFYDLPASA